MKPTVGRIVHYQPPEGGYDPQAAIITRVWSDTCVNLTVFQGNGFVGSLTSVEFSEQPAPGRWTWPPRV